MTVDPNVATLASIILSTISVVIALVSFVMNYRLKKHEDKQSQELAQVQLKLQELQLHKEEAAAERLTRSRVEAHHVLIGTKGHKLRIANTGGVTITNATCTADEGSGPYAFMQDKEPFERLEPGECFDEMMLMAMGTPSKFTIITRWVDPDGNEHSRKNIVTW